MEGRRSKLRFYVCVCHLYEPVFAVGFCVPLHDGISLIVISRGQRGEMHNAEMPSEIYLSGFLRGIMVGAGTVFALLVMLGIGMPRRSEMRATRRRTLE